MIITKTPLGTNYQNNSKTISVVIHPVEDEYFVVFKRDGEASKKEFKSKAEAIEYATYLINGE